MPGLILDELKEFCRRTGIPVPSYAVGNVDDQVIQLVSLVNEVMEDVCTRFAWQELVQETVFTTQAQANQGAMTTLAPNGFLWILNDTIWNRSLRLPVFGPQGQAQWQMRQALPSVGPFNTYRIRGGNLLFNPTPAAGQTCAFEYASNACVIAVDNTTKARWTADTDVFLLDTRLLMKGLRWKWKSEKGLDYAQEFDDYEQLVNNLKGRDGTKGPVRMDGADGQLQPGIFVTSGNWSL